MGIYLHIRILLDSLGFGIENWDGGDGYWIATWIYRCWRSKCCEAAGRGLVIRREGCLQGRREAIVSYVHHNRVSKLLCSLEIYRRPAGYNVLSCVVQGTRCS